MKSTYHLGNIDLHGRGRKGNRVFVIFDDTSDHRKPGDEYGGISYRITCANGQGWEQCGQCQDTLAKFPEIAVTALFKTAVALREKYGLTYRRLWKKCDNDLFVALCHGTGEE
jgi:hypothetical protein